MAGAALCWASGSGAGSGPRDRPADQQREQIVALRAREPERGELGLGLGQQRFGLAIIERRGDAGIEPALADAQPPRGGCAPWLRPA